MKRIVEDIAATQNDHSAWVLVGNRLRARRAHLGLAIEAVAEDLGVEPSLYERYEEGRDQPPAALLAEAAGKFGVPLLWFFQDVAALDTQDDVSASVGQAPAYVVATPDDRAQCMASYFRQLDFAGQQHLLTIARALTQAGRKPKGEVLQFGSREASAKAAPRRLRRNPRLQNPSRKSN